MCVCGNNLFSFLLYSKIKLGCLHIFVCHHGVVVHSLRDENLAELSFKMQAVPRSKHTPSWL